LREAVDQYGWFGRRACYRDGSALPGMGSPVFQEAAPPRIEAPQQQPSTAPAVAVIRVVVPADAAVWFDDRPTTTTGPVRLFVSPPLAADQEYHYEIQARWFEDGKETRRAVRVRIYPGDRQTVDFLDPQPRTAGR
jgi:uncharacterized protein (TIGR03000 family)